MLAHTLLFAGVALVAIGIVLRVLGSFAFIFVLGLGLYVTACGLIARAVPDRGIAAVLILITSALYVYVNALVASPLAYLALGLLAIALAALVTRIVGRR